MKTTKKITDCYRVLYTSSSNEKPDYTKSKDFPPTDQGRNDAMDYVISLMKQTTDGEFWLYKRTTRNGEVYLIAILEVGEYRDQFTSKLKNLEAHKIVEFIPFRPTEVLDKSGFIGGMKLS